MDFTTLEFIFVFLPIFLAVYLLSKQPWRLHVILAANGLFILRLYTRKLIYFGYQQSQSLPIQPDFLLTSIGRKVQQPSWQHGQVFYPYSSHSVPLKHQLSGSATDTQTYTFVKSQKICFCATQEDLLFLSDISILPFNPFPEHH